MSYHNRNTTIEFSASYYPRIHLVPNYFIRCGRCTSAAILNLGPGAVADQPR